MSQGRDSVSTYNLLSDGYLPERVNDGPWVSAYTLDRLQTLAPQKYLLPVCSMWADLSEVSRLGEFLLPPLYTEAMSQNLRVEIIHQIRKCFPVLQTADAIDSSAIEVVEISGKDPSRIPDHSGSVIVFSVDTAVEEHGPHLPLCTDTLQSYGVLQELCNRDDRIVLGKPLDYGQLTWGLPFGCSVDLTEGLLSKYVSGYVNALSQEASPLAIYVVDVHGSIAHRKAIVEGLESSNFNRWSFRWLHEPLTEFASARGDQHAGGVETALVEYLNPQLLDAEWWPQRLEDLAAHQMEFQTAVTLASDLPLFSRHVREQKYNGIIGDIRNYRLLDAAELFDRMCTVASKDIEELLSGGGQQDSGTEHW